MTRVDIKVTGNAQLQRALAAVGDDMTAALEAAVTGAAMIIRNEASRRAPFRTGTLRRSLTVRTAERSATRVVAEVATNTPYARILEYGGTIKHPGGTPYLFTGFAHLAGVTFLKKDGSYPAGTKFTKPHDIKMPAKPYMRPAVDAKKAAATEAIAKSMRAILAKRAGQ